MNISRPYKGGKRTYFVDLYNAEFSRDIDPMKGGYMDNYYYQLIANIRRYKGARAVPVASQTKTISMDRDFRQWSDVGPEFRDNVGDVLHRDFDGWGSLHYDDDSGRNDIRVAKVAHDRRNLYFYVRTVAPLTPSSGSKWMVLFLDVDRDAKTGWHGYDYRVAGQTLQKWSGTYWSNVSSIPFKWSSNELQLMISKKRIGYLGGVDFKWEDNCSEDGLFLGGDAAPPRRFNYRFQEAGDKLRKSGSREKS